MMKYLRLLLCLSAVTLTFASCKKEYTCTCDGGLGGQGFSTSVRKANRSRAQEACADLNTNSPDGFHDCSIR